MKRVKKSIKKVALNVPYITLFRWKGATIIRFTVGDVRQEIMVSDKMLESNGMAYNPPFNWTEILKAMIVRPTAIQTKARCPRMDTSQND